MCLKKVHNFNIQPFVNGHVGTSLYIKSTDSDIIVSCYDNMPICMIVQLKYFNFFRNCEIYSKLLYW